MESVVEKLNNGEVKRSYENIGTIKVLNREEYTFNNSTDHIIKQYDRGKLEYIQEKMGNLIKEDKFENGELIRNITVNSYYENGEFHIKGKETEYLRENIMSITEIKDNVLDGEKIEYTKSGDIFSKKEYKDGFLKDDSKNKFEDDFLVEYQDHKFKSNIRYDFLEGKFEDYYDNGKLKATGEYHKGEKNGVFSEYSEKGELIKSQLFSKGEVIKDMLKVAPEKKVEASKPKEVQKERATRSRGRSKGQER
nr:hypothetical protein [uncultured Fusobacterium sp.]